MKYILSFMVLLLSTMASHAERWKIGNYNNLIIDPVRAAISVNDDGIELSIFRNDDNSVQMALSLPKSSFEQFKNSGTVGVFRIDDGEAIDIVSKDATVYGRTVETRLWHGEDPTPLGGTLRDVLEGDTIFVRLYVESGAYLETSFPLDGAREAIAASIGVNPDVNSEEAKAAIKKNIEVSRSMILCMKSYSYDTCRIFLAYCEHRLKTAGKSIEICMSE